MDNMRTAIHEAGHAVMCCVNREKNGSEPVSITIIPDNDTLGLFRCTGWPEDFDPEVCEYEDGGRFNTVMISHLLIDLAGCAAEKIAFGEFNDEGMESDFAQAAEIALGLGYSHLDGFLEQTEEVLRKCWPAVQKLADILIQRLTLNADEIVEIIERVLQENGISIQDVHSIIQWASDDPSIAPSLSKFTDEFLVDHYNKGIELGFVSQEYIDALRKEVSRRGIIVEIEKKVNELG